jgi:hypothetical protein
MKCIPKETKRAKEENPHETISQKKIFRLEDVNLCHFLDWAKQSQVKVWLSQMQILTKKTGPLNTLDPILSISGFLLPFPSKCYQNIQYKLKLILKN